MAPNLDDLASPMQLGDPEPRPASLSGDDRQR